LKRRSRHRRVQIKFYPRTPQQLQFLLDLEKELKSNGIRFSATWESGSQNHPVRNWWMLKVRGGVCPNELLRGLTPRIPMGFRVYWEGKSGGIF